MHQAICDKCGASCEVPFRPSGDKPIFCNDCFDRKGGRDDRPRRETDNNQDLKMQLDNINAKLDKILASLTLPKPAKEVIKKKKKSKV
jgi:CxxC-x17-CxxC domain-containing protein